MSMNKNFCHLHVHNEYSYLDGFGSAEQYVERAKEMGFTSLALTNHGNIDGVIKFQKACLEHDVHPVVGVELYIVNNATIRDRNIKSAHITVLAKNRIGFRNILKMLTYAHTTGFYYRPRIDFHNLLSNLRGLIILSGCSNSFMNLPNGDKLVGQLIKELKDDFYFELMPHNFEDQIKTNKLALKLSRQYDSKCVVTNDCHYILENDSDVHDTLLAIQTKSKKDDKERYSFSVKGLHLRSYEEMEGCLVSQGIVSRAESKKLFSNTMEIVEKCKDFKIERKPVYLPSVINEENKTDKQFLYELCLLSLVEKGLDKDKKYIERVKEEYRVITARNFERYFLIVWDMVKWCKSNDIFVGPGRGSCGGSLIAYLLNITMVDPFKFDLLFPRFISETREDLPDIDLDFEDVKRHKVREYLISKYGAENVAGLSTFLTMKGKMALRDVCRTYDIPLKDVDKISKSIDDEAGFQWSFENVQDCISFRVKYPGIVDTIFRLENQIRSVGQHPAAIVISKNNIGKGTNAYMKIKDENSVVNWDMKDAEYMGMIKLDVLGLNTLTVLSGTAKLIKERKGIDIDFQEIKLDDPRILNEFTLGHTVGCFQFGCLSGDTFVGIENPKMIKDVQIGDVLESVYNGKVIKNIVKRIKKTGNKLVYYINVSGGIIKATKEHEFLTKEGWKKLSDITTEDEVFMADLDYTFCPCGCGIKKYNRRNSGDFYGWVVGHPSKIPNSHIKISRTVNKLWKNETYINKCSKAREIALSNPKVKEKHLRNTKRAHQNKKYRKSISDTMTELWKNPKYKKSQSKAIKNGWEKSPVREEMIGNSRGGGASNFGFRPDISHYIRSSWEANYSRILIFLNKKYEYEPKAFYLSDGTTYRPDFKIGDKKYVELKGYFDEKSKTKIKLFKEEHPDIKLIVIGKKEYKKLKNKYKDKIEWENTELLFKKVKSIKKWGFVETWDLEMENSKAPNYIANGFVVHNSYGIRKMCGNLSIDKFEDIVMATSLYRPSTLQMGVVDEIINRKKGENKTEYYNKKHEEITKSTYGMFVYQEQIMRVLNEIGGMTIGHADNVRKAMEKSKIEEVKKYREEFIVNSVKNKELTKDQAIEIMDNIEGMSAYSFCKAHAVEYSFLSYWCQFLKMNYPLEFICANLTYAAESKKDELISEGVRMGIKINLPKIGMSDKKEWKIIGEELYCPFIEIKGFGEKTAEKFAENKKDGSGKKTNAKIENILSDIKKYEDGKDVDIGKHFSFRVPKYKTFEKIIGRISEFSPILTLNKMSENKLSRIAGEIKDGKFTDFNGDTCKIIGEHSGNNLITGRLVEKVLLPIKIWPEGKIINGDLGDLNISLIKKVSFINKDVQNCSDCSLRKECKRPSLPTEGKYNLMIVGEAPGKTEDKVGMCFCGKAGTYMWEVFSTFDLYREYFHVTNVCKCFPSVSRRPTAVHIDSCRPWLDEEIKKVNPILILSLGNTPLKFFNDVDGGITNKNASIEWNDKYNCWICWCLHPSSVLHDPDKQKEFEEGIKFFSDKVKSIGKF